VKVLVGNKADLSGEREVSFDQGKEFADALGMQFIETSAKSALNVERTFTMIGEEIKAKYHTHFAPTDPKKKRSINLEGRALQLKQAQSSCC
jgi:Ras-related protein Rab-1A